MVAEDREYVLVWRRFFDTAVACKVWGGIGAVLMILGVNRIFDNCSIGSPETSRESLMQMRETSSRPHMEIVAAGNTRCSMHVHRREGAVVGYRSRCTWR